jgi:GAF domain-containing protein
VPAVALALLSIAEFVVADLVLDARFPPESAQFLEKLQEKLGTTTVHEEIVKVLKTCVDSFKGCDRTRISSTVHLRVSIMSNDGLATQPALIQLSDYTRAGLGGRRWRLIEHTKGLVGRCLRLEELVWVNFRAELDYRARMVEEFGFTRDEVEKHTKSARSYLAFPLRDRGETVGVIYFFSTEPQVFPLAASEDGLRDTGEVIVGFLRTADVL